MHGSRRGWTDSATLRGYPRGRRAITCPASVMALCIAVISSAALLYSPISVAPFRAQTTRHASHSIILAEGDSPFGGILRGIASGLASALESALDSGFPGRLQLIADAEAALREDERVTDLFGSDVTIGEVDAKESMSVTAGTWRKRCRACDACLLDTADWA